MPSRSEDIDRFVISVSASLARRSAISSRAAARSASGADRDWAMVRISALSRATS